MLKSPAVLCGPVHGKLRVVLSKSSTARRLFVLGLCCLLGCASVQPLEPNSSAVHDKAVREARAQAVSGEIPVVSSQPEPAPKRSTLEVVSLVAVAGAVCLGYVTFWTAQSRSPEHWNEAPVPALAISTLGLGLTGLLLSQFVPTGNGKE